MIEYFNDADKAKAKTKAQKAAGVCNEGCPVDKLKETI